MKDNTWRLLFAIMSLVMVVIVIYGVFAGKEDIADKAILMLLCFNTSLLFRDK